MIALTAVIAKREREARRAEAQRPRLTVDYRIPPDPIVYRWRPKQWPPIIQGWIPFRKRGDNGKRG